MDKEKWHRPRLYQFSMLFMLPPGWIILGTIRAQFMAPRKPVSYCGTKNRIVLFSHYPQVSATQIESMWKLCTTKKKEPCWWRKQNSWRRVIKTYVKKSKQTVIRWKALWCVLKSVPASICVSPHQREIVQSKVLYSRSATKHDCLLINAKVFALSL